MSYNGSGTFVINTAGQPVVSGTVISSTAFNALTADLATGLSTAITKDGQTTPTANIPMGSNKITGLAVGTAAADAATLSQVQSTTAKLVNSVSGADTITGTMSPTLGAYAAGQMFYFVAAGDNTGAVTINIDSLGAKSVTRDGAVALAASDIKSGEVIVIVYDGTRFQVVSQLNSAGDARFANVSIASALNVGGVATFSAGTAAAPSITTTGDTNTGIFFPAADTIAFTEGGVEALRIDSSGQLGIGTTSPQDKVSAVSTQGLNTFANPVMTYGANLSWPAGFANIYDASYVDQFMLLNARMTGGTRAAPTFTSSGGNGGVSLKTDGLDGGLAIQTIPNGSAQSATTRLYLNPSGNLGLGVTPVAWVTTGKALQVSSYGSLLSSTAGDTHVINNAYLNASASAWVYLNSSQASRYEQYQGAHAWYTAASGTAGNTISFTQALTLDASGNLVVGNIGASGVATATPIFASLGNTFASTTGDAAKTKLRVFQDNAANIYGFGVSSGILEYHVPLTAVHAWYINNTERARISSGGSFIVGATASVEGALFCTSFNGSAVPGVTIADTSAVATANMLFFHKSGAVRGSIQSTATTTAYNTSSDRRLKDNIAPADDAGLVIDAIEVVKHDWKVGGHTRYGMIAQDLYMVAPEAVSVGDADDVEELKQPWGVDYSKLVPMLVKEVQSLRARVAALEAK